MTDLLDQPAVTTKYSTDAQSQARKLLRRLMAERNIRTTQMGGLLGEEAHTIRRALNGSRSVTLDEVVRIATLGGYSLDEHFLQQPARNMPASSSAEPLENSLSRVFAAIADLLAAQGSGPVKSPPAFDFADPATEALQRRRPTVKNEDGTPRRGRGRPRKVAPPTEDLPGPQW